MEQGELAGGAFVPVVAREPLPPFRLGPVPDLAVVGRSVVSSVKRKVGLNQK